MVMDIIYLLYSQRWQTTEGLYEQHSRFICNCAFLHSMWEPGCTCTVHWANTGWRMEHGLTCLKQPCNSLTFCGLANQLQGKAMISGKQLTGRLPLTIPLLYNILFYYLLLLIAFHSPCHDMGECHVWKIGGSATFKS